MRNSSKNKCGLSPILLWLLLLIIPLFGRTFFQIDETRYVAVAWEMWVRGDWLVPYLNGEAYHHKPPLLFWLINLGWGIFGVNEWWPRVVSGLFSLASLWLTVYIARLLWPQRPNVAAFSPLILLSCFLWSLFTSATMFDMVLAFFTLVGMVALILAWQNGGKRAWVLFGLAIGLGTLTKGPVILLHLLPVALLAPWWQRTSPTRNWYLGVFGGVGLGALIALAWAIPAGLAGGPEFQQAIFWGQTANRLVNSFAHSHPWWWYLPLLPIMLFPWLLWPPFWRGLAHLLEHRNASSVRFCLIWFGVVFGGFSLVSGKQLHYLLPILPAFALLTSYLLVKHQQQYHRCDTLLPALVIILLGFLILIVPFVSAQIRLPVWLVQISPLPGIMLFLLGAVLILWKLPQIKQQLLLISTIAILTGLIFPLAIIKTAWPAYDLRQISQHISTLIKHKQPVAHFGDYHGQYQFFGRLQQPLPVVDENNLCTWLSQHPNGKLIAYFSGKYLDLSEQADYVQFYRSKHVGIIGVQLVSISACLGLLP